MRTGRIFILILVLGLLSAFTNEQAADGGETRGKRKVTKVWIIGDSTVADYSLESDYQAKRYPIMGWGQVFQAFMSADSLPFVRHIIKSDSVIVDDRARGGRSTRSFFEEGRWAEVCNQLNPGDIVMIQFGHNDASVNKGERYTSLPGYKEFLRLYVNQSREKGAIPVLVTPVARNYPWKDGELGNTHGDYPDAMRQVAQELNAYLIDLTGLSMEFFTRKGQAYVTTTYFMNFPAGMYEGYPDGSRDNTHFQPAGATAVASLIFDAMKTMKTGYGTVVRKGKVSEGIPVAQKGVSAPAGEIYRDLEFEMPQVIEPLIPLNSVSITDFGAVGDGMTLNTEAFRKAIETISSKGGGTVIIPRGMWLTGPILLRSNIRLHTDEGALVIFSPDKSLYPLIETSFEGYNTVRCMSPIYGKDLENIAFTGKGIWDGSGEAWRPVKRDKVPPPQWKDIISSGGVMSDDGKTWFPSLSYKKAQEISDMNVPQGTKSLADFQEIKDFLRPVMVSLVNCRRILIDGSTFQNSPAWCLHPLMCEDLTVRNITVRNPWYSQNGDGIDIESCRNTLLYDSNFDVGDDAICIKSGKDEDGRKRGRPTENLVIRNCIVYHGHGGVTIGSEMSGGVRNVSASGCTFMGTDVGLRFKSNRGRGGVVENIWFSDILMTNIPTQAISFNLYYGGLSMSELLDEGKNIESDTLNIPAVTDETPQFRDITIRDITCRGAQQAAYLQGLPELNLEDITLENLDIAAENGITCIDSKDVAIKNLKLQVKNKPLLRFINSSDVSISNFILPDDKDSLFEVKGAKSRNIIVGTVTPGGNANERRLR
jgi:polygalacturonase/lysophospholipase L1-like esterase